MMSNNKYLEKKCFMTLHHLSNGWMLDERNSHNYKHNETATKMPHSFALSSTLLHYMRLSLELKMLFLYTEQ